MSVIFIPKRLAFDKPHIYFYNGKWRVSIPGCSKSSKSVTLFVNMLNIKE